MKRYVNYHCHTQYSNVSTPDSTITNKDRANRVVELGSTVLSGVEHGWTGRFIEIYELAKENNIKPLFGTEAYFVKDRFEKDRTNAHIIILAKNDNGRKALNWILSEANVTGYYYKARLDVGLILSLPKDDVWITTGCVGGVWKYDDAEEIIIKLKEHFGKNLFLEVQPHNTESQKKLNLKILEISERLSIDIVAGMDSHMIYPEQVKERDDYLLSRGIEYPDEEGWYLDYPDYEEAVKRFNEQGILMESEIEKSLQNTLVFENVEEYKSVAFDKTKIKLPTLFPNKSQKEKDEFFESLIWNLWSEEKKNIPLEKISHYEDEIKKELSVVFKTGISDYFLLDYEIIKRGKELGGSITMTGRGSAPSYYLAKLLGFTTVDRISATVKLFPERFISAERLLETKSLPDVDMNLGTPEIFAEAQREIMGDGHSYRMISFNTLGVAGAWKLYARISDIDFETANEISNKIKEYDWDLKHIEEGDDEISVYDYIDEKYHEIYKKSTKYLGIINALNSHPCGFLLYSEEDIRKEFGLIKIKTGDKEKICVAIDGLFAEQYKMLKNDLLKVVVVDLIYKTYERVGIKPHTLPELLKVCEGNEKVWNIYKNGIGMGVNQVEQKGTIERVASYSPKNISELSAFIAAIRPGFKSNYKQFEARLPFSYGIKSLDNLIQTEEFPQSYMLYQENAMQVLAYAGIPIAETYEVIKNIAKKRVEKVIKYKDKFISGMSKKIMDVEKVDKNRAKEISDMTWKIIEDSSRYSFNSSHSYSVAGDSLYGAYLKSYYPVEFYEVLLGLYEESGDKDKLQTAKLEAEKHFGISFPKYKFRQDNRNIVGNPEKKEISSSIKSIKGFGDEIGQTLYELGKIEFNDFLDFLVYCEKNKMISSKFETLIKLGYFSEFGKNKKLLKFFQEFRKGKSRYADKLTEKSKIKRLAELKEIFINLPEEDFTVMEQISNEISVLDRIDTKFASLKERLGFVIDLDTKNSPKVRIQSLRLGNIETFKVSKKIFRNKEFCVGQILKLPDGAIDKKQSVRYAGEDENGKPKYDPIEGRYDFWLLDYSVVNNI